jgi:CSLREA domain-containing protein
MWWRMSTAVVLAGAAFVIGDEAAHDDLCSNPTYRVTSTTDGGDVDPGDGRCADAAGRCTLRGAILEANARRGPDVIALQAGTYLLERTGAGEDAADRGDLDLTDDTIVCGDGASTTVLDAQRLDRAFHLHRDVSASIAGLTIQGGKADGDGGGILNDAGILSLTSTAVHANESEGNGGGIGNTPGARLSVSGSAITWNRSARSGGGISNAGEATVVGSTLGRNTAALSGGGIVGTADSSAEMVNVTVAENRSASGGGIFSETDGFFIHNSIVADSVNGENCAGTLSSSGYNLSSDRSCPFTQRTDRTDLDPRLMALGLYEGTTLVFPLAAGSPAIDLAPADPPLPSDQTGAPRLGGTGIDAGAFEFHHFRFKLSFQVHVAALDGQGPGGAVLYRRTTTNLQTGGMILLNTQAAPTFLAEHPTQKRLAVGWNTTGSFSGGVRMIDAATAGTLWTWTPPLGHITDLAFHPNGTRLYAPEANGTCIWVLDTSTGSPLDCIYFQAMPEDVAVSVLGDKLYVAHDLEAKISVIDLTTKAKVNEIPIKATDLVANRKYAFLYVATISVDQSPDMFHVIQAVSDVVVSSTPAYWPSDLTVSHDGNRVYVVSSPVYTKVLVFDLFGSYLAEASVPWSPVDGALHPYDGVLYLSHLPYLPYIVQRQVTAVSTQSLQVLATAPVPAAEGPFGLVVQ